MSDGTGKQLTTVKCEKHGLRYNPAIHSGCVRCRKEAGEKIGRAAGGGAAIGRAAGGGAAISRAAGGGAPTGGPAPAAGDSVIAPLAVALVLIAVTGGAFFAMHQQFYESAPDLFGVEGDPLVFDEELGGELPELPEEIELTPEERQQLEELRDEFEKVIGETPDG